MNKISKVKNVDLVMKLYISYKLIDDITGNANLGVTSNARQKGSFKI